LQWSPDEVSCYGKSENAASMVRMKAEKYVTALVLLVLKMMTELEDEDDWTISDEINDEDSGENNVIAESALDRLACGLGGKAILPHIVSNIPSMLNNPDWRCRHAALMAISAAGDGCHKQMESMLDNIIQGVLKYLLDPHPRVRYAACNAIGYIKSYMIFLTDIQGLTRMLFECCSN
jgi:importin-5